MYHRNLQGRIAKFLKIFILSLLLIKVCSLIAAQGDVHTGYPKKSWDKVSSPAEIGWSSEKLKLAEEYSTSIGSLAVMIIDNGVVVNEWGDTKKLNNVYSVRKSFLSALYGVYVSEGNIDLTSTLEELGIDDNEPKLTNQEKQARIVDLLKARSGVYHPALYETPQMKANRPVRGSHAPGTFWYYNNWDFNALGTILEKQTNLSVYEAFKIRIADPLEMEDFQLQDQAFVRGSESIHPAYPFKMSARDMARFGLLFLRQGEWNGNQVIPKEWISKSTTSYSNARPGVGYGYLWWVSEKGWLFGNKINTTAYSARGHGGQYIVVIPAFNLVVVHNNDYELTHNKIDNKQFGNLLKLILNAKLNLRQ